MTTKRPKKELPVIGWREWVALPDLGGAVVRAKIDTGARTASLHAFGLELFERNGKEYARFAIHPDHRSPGPAVIVETPVLGHRTVRNPGGRSEERPIIKTKLTIGRYRLTAELNLTRRDNMGMPMLLGRHTVRRRFLVDPGRSYLIGPAP
ncbi:MAG: RimK/LysX family protein, partial [Acidimicrobiia bacterium]|nr:RimK/LysX family protein [Acidimicrobiia bacterium]